MLSLVLSNVLAAGALAALALLAGRVFRRPALAHALWLLVLIKLVTPPLVRVEVPWPAAAPTAAPEPEREPVFVEGFELHPDAVAEDVLRLNDDVAAAPPPADVPFDGTRWAVGLWAAGAVGWFALAGWRAAAFARLLALARPAGDALTARVAEVAQRLGVRCPPVRVVAGRVSPLVWGVFRPVLVLPAGLESAVGPAGWRTLVAHELAHVRRGDPLVRGLELIVTGLYWWCPLAWLACRELREAEEQCCDAWVVRTLPDDTKVYATALIDVLDFLAEAAAPEPLGCGLGPVADLKRRLTMILTGTTSPRLGRGSNLTMLLVASLGLPFVPGWSTAQDTKPKAEERKEIFFLARVAAEDADAAKLAEEVAKKAKELEELKKKLAEGTKPKTTKVVAGMPMESGKTVTIEVGGLSGKPEEIEAAVKKIREALGGDKNVTVKVGETRRIAIFSGPDGKMLMEMKPGQHMPSKVTVPGVPHAPAAPKPPVPALSGFAPMGGGARGPGADRLEHLERRMEEMMKRMEEMTRELRKKGSESSTKPSKP